nr:hypothetical protein Iba_scaffold14379.3CG0090 [Ipomoea batatas]
MGSDESTIMASYFPLGAFLRNSTASPMWSLTLGSSNPIANSGKNLLLTSITILSISQMSITSTELWREISLRTPPSPPPQTKTCSYQQPQFTLFFTTRGSALDKSRLFLFT